VLATVAQCLERARQCEWSASLTEDERDRKFLLWKAQQYMKFGRGEGAAGPCALSGPRALEVYGQAWSASWLERRS
jgi:hypothetical protein